MASSDEYQQRRSFEESVSEQEKCEIALKQLVDKHGLKEKFRKSFMDSIITGEMRIEIEN